MVGIPSGDGPSGEGWHPHWGWCVFSHPHHAQTMWGWWAHPSGDGGGIPTGDGGIQKWLRREQLNKMVPKLRDHKTIAIKKINEWSKKMC